MTILNQLVNDLDAHGVEPLAPHREPTRVVTCSIEEYEDGTLSLAVGATDDALWIGAAGIPSRDEALGTALRYIARSLGDD